jgi:hypothetical protein
VARQQQTTPVVDGMAAANARGGCVQSTSRVAVGIAKRERARLRPATRVDARTTMPQATVSAL